MSLTKKPIYTQTYNLLFGVLVGAEQVDCLHVSKVNVVAKQENEQQLADIFLLAVTIQSFVSFELGTNVGKLFINPFNLCFFTLT